LNCKFESALHYGNVDCDEVPHIAVELHCVSGSLQVVNISLWNCHCLV